MAQIGEEKRIRIVKPEKPPVPERREAPEREPQKLPLEEPQHA